jgi:hypothetical protein
MKLHLTQDSVITLMTHNPSCRGERTTGEILAKKPNLVILFFFFFFLKWDFFLVFIYLFIYLFIILYVIYTVAVLRHSRRESQISLRMVVSHHVVAGI